MKTLVKHSASGMICGLLLLSACSSQPKPSLVGHWQSFELGGKDMAGTTLKEVDYEFRLDGHFSAVGTVAGDHKQTFTGHYSVGITNLDMTTDGKGLQKMPYTLKDGVLTIRDPKLDSYVSFRKANP
jgi:hypothetical protein